MPKLKIKGDSEHPRARRRAKSRMKSRPYRMSQKMRKFIEPMIGWMKTAGSLSRTGFIGQERIQDDVILMAASWNPLRMTHLTRATQGIDALPIGFDVIGSMPKPVRQPCCRHHADSLL